MSNSGAPPSSLESVRAIGEYCVRDIEVDVSGFDRGFGSHTPWRGRFVAVDSEEGGGGEVEDAAVASGGVVVLVVFGGEGGCQLGGEGLRVCRSGGGRGRRWTAGGELEGTARTRSQGGEIVLVVSRRVRHGGGGAVVVESAECRSCLTSEWAHENNGFGGGQGPSVLLASSSGWKKTGKNAGRRRGKGRGEQVEVEVGEGRSRSQWFHMTDM